MRVPNFSTSSGDDCPTGWTKITTPADPTFPSIGGSEGGQGVLCPPWPFPCPPWIHSTILILETVESCIHTVFRSIESQWTNRRQQLQMYFTVILYTVKKVSLSFCAKIEIL